MTSDRDRLVTACRHLAGRGLSPGGSGSLAVRVGGELLVTPTGSSCSRVRADELALVPLDPASSELSARPGAGTSGRADDSGGSGGSGGGPRPSKEVGLHRAVFRARPDATAVVHLHAPFTVAAACLDPAAGGPDGTGPLPPLTPYQLMRLGRLPVAPYARPGSNELAASVGALAVDADVLLLANHGSVVAAGDLDRAVDLAEELEAACRLHFTLLGTDHRRLPPGG